MSWWRALLRGISSFTLWPEPVALKWPTPSTPEQALQADAEAIASDWQAVGADLRQALKNFDKPEEPHTMRTRDILRSARRDGAYAGKAAASWTYDGNTKPEWFASVLKGLRDGDPAVLDAFNVPNLSGEWADSQTPQGLAEEYGLDETRDPDGTLLDEVCTAWENAAQDAFWWELERVCIFYTKGN